MKIKTVKLIGIALVAIMAFSFTACEMGSDNSTGQPGTNLPPDQPVGSRVSSFLKQYRMRQEI